MSQDPRLGPLYSYQRDPGSERTVLPSRPLSSKPNDMASLPPQERTRLPTSQDPPKRSQTTGDSPKTTSPSVTTVNMAKDQSPGSQRGAKTSPPPAGSQGQGQVCR